jgi:glycosyltransferase involved in cell wall biosynthesis
MKIAYIVLKGMPLGGGIEKYTEELGSRLVRKGHDVVVYAMQHHGAEDGTYRGMEIRTVPTIQSKSFEKITASFVATIRHSLKNDADIVHFHAFGPAMFSFIPRLLGKKVVVQGHGLEWKRSRWGAAGRLFLKLAEIPSVRSPHVLSVVSEVQKKYLKDTYGRESVCIPTGVNPPQLEKPDLIKQYGLQGNDYILFAARLVQEKGAHYLIEAYKRLKTDMKLVIAGDAQHEDAYKSRLHTLAAGNKNIVFTGFVTGKVLHELFTNCYLFVLPSEIEGLPTALLEAMSYGNCCLVSDIPENLEAMNDFGFTFKNMDTADLAKKLTGLIHDPDKVGSIKKQAKDHVLKNHSWDRIADDFEQLYTRLLEPDPDRRGSKYLNREGAKAAKE